MVWVLMKEQADLSSARATQGWVARGNAVRDALMTTARSKQTSIQSFLSQRSASFRPFWIVNALRVRADKDTVAALSTRPDVAAVLPDRVYALPPLQRNTDAPPKVNALEWGIANVRAGEAWDAFGSRGEDIVIANIDSGVQFDHPALQRQYRGNEGGTLDHNYNWFDPSNVCGTPSSGPCDNAGHGTHTMGTMVGSDESGENQIGVAPNARWIAAKGCEDFGCSEEALLASAEWILAPTDLNGENPRPELRPNIVNNSWGGGGGDTFYQAAVQAWVAAGIFPVFSAGNSGPSCDTTGSPGDYPESYAVAAYDVNNEIAIFSSRGPGLLGAGKPNIAGPGVGVRSSVPGSGYEVYDGTSMAAPHVAGTIALLWSAAPALLGDIEGTR
ncbi:MAG: S8 family serine peptidase, partial [Polyangiales bacterium]